MKRIFLLAAVLLLSAMTRVGAMMAYVSENDLLAQADLIVVGTVTSETREAGVPDYFAMMTQIKVTQTLRGPKMETVTARHAAVPNMGGGMIIMDHGGFNLPVGEARLFFLQRGPGGYTIVGGFQGQRPAADADRFAKLAGAFPLSASLKGAVGPFYFGQPFTLQITVKNAGDKALKVYEPRPEAFYFSTKLGGYAQLDNVPQEKPATYPVVVDPGKETTIAVQVKLAKSQGWQIFPADSYLLTPLAVRARIYVEQPADATPGTAAMRVPGFFLASAWSLTLGGFPPPSELAK